jgi:hypothetical protein
MLGIASSPFSRELPSASKLSRAERLDYGTAIVIRGLWGSVGRSLILRW